MTALKTEISRIALTSQFAGVDLLTGGFSAAFLVGANGGQFISVNISAAQIPGINGFSATGLGLDSTQTVETVRGASALLTIVDGALSAIGGARADLGAIQNRFQSTIRNLASISENASAARSRIRDTDFAIETAELTRWQIIQQASTTVLGQANQRPQAALSLLQ